MSAHQGLGPGASGPALTAAAAGPVSPADQRLETELIRLQQDFSTHPSHLRLGVQAVLLHGRTRQVTAGRGFDQQTAAPSEDAQGGVAAARVATQRMLVSLAAFCAQAAGLP